MSSIWDGRFPIRQTEQKFNLREQIHLNAGVTEFLSKFVNFVQDLTGFASEVGATAFNRKCFTPEQRKMIITHLQEALEVERTYNLDIQRNPENFKNMEALFNLTIDILSD